MLLWVMLALVLLLILNVREGVENETLGAKDAEPAPTNSKPCKDFEKEMKSNFKDVDISYCRGFYNKTCGMIDTTRVDKPCPVGYAQKSTLAFQRADEMKPSPLGGLMQKKPEKDENGEVKKEVKPDAEPKPNHGMPCTKFEADVKASNFKNYDYKYCRGFNNEICGYADAKNPDRLCPAGYEPKSIQEFIRKEDPTKSGITA